jgi:hypothetical protein
MIEFTTKMFRIFPDKIFQLFEIREKLSHFENSNFRIKFLIAQLDMVITKRGFVESFRVTKYLNDLSKEVNQHISDLKTFFS